MTNIEQVLEINGTTIFCDPNKICLVMNEEGESCRRKAYEIINLFNNRSRSSKENDIKYLKMVLEDSSQALKRCRPLLDTLSPKEHYLGGLKISHSELMNSMEIYSAVLDAIKN
jgi:hypothetical protein